MHIPDSALENSHWNSLPLLLLLLWFSEYWESDSGSDWIGEVGSGESKCGGGISNVCSGEILGLLTGGLSGLLFTITSFTIISGKPESLSKSIKKNIKYNIFIYKICYKCHVFLQPQKK